MGFADECASRHGGNEQSRAANERNKHHRSEMRQKVLEAIKDSHDGLTMKELASHWDVQFSSISGRGSELKKAGLVEPSGVVRDGSAVLVVTALGWASFSSPARAPEPRPVPTRADVYATAMDTVVMEWCY